MITFDQKTREKLVKGVTLLEQSVSTTLGPRGCNVGIDEGFRKRVVHDGVTVARNVTSKDPVEEFGIAVLREAAEKTVQSVGDGTTVTIVLAKAVLEEAMKQISANVNPMSIRKPLEEDLQKLLEEIKLHTTEIKPEQMKQIATISAEDPDLGTLVADTVKEAGKHGIVTVEESKDPNTTVENQKGMTLERGWASGYFITNPTRKEAELKNVKVMITDFPMNEVVQIIPFMGEFMKRHTSLVVIAPEFGEEMLTSFILNKVEGRMASLCIKAPLFGETQLEILEDIATLTGATVLSKQKGQDLTDMTMEYLGTAEKVLSDIDSTLILSSENEQAVQERIRRIEKQMETETEWRAAKLKERLAKLTDGVSVIRVGGATEIEMNERKERVIDAVEALKSAMKSGIVAGGETIYLKIRKVLKEDSILYRALEKPFLKLVENAGYNGGQMLERLNNSFEDLPQAGIDVLSGEIEDLLHIGIIDPSSVSQEALKNAVSVATQLLTTNVVITKDKDKDAVPNMRR